MAKWNDLPKDLAIKIAEHIKSYDDFETFFDVCSQWRSATNEANFRGGGATRDHRCEPWLMLPDHGGAHYDNNNNHHHHRCYSLSKRMVRNVNNLPPQLHTRYIIIVDEARWLSSHGWLLSSSSVNYNRALSLSLINPFSGVVIKLPVLSRDDISPRPNIRKFTLSANPSTTSDFTVGMVFYFNNHLVSWKNGDTKWTIYVGTSLAYLNVAFYKGELYAVDIHGEVMTFGTSPQKKFSPPRRWRLGIPTSTHHLINFYLVVLLDDGRLVMVSRVLGLIKDDNNKIINFETMFFMVFEVDVEKNGGEMSRVTSLRNRAFFVGCNSSFSVEVEPSDDDDGSCGGCKDNCIYYTDDSILRIYRWSSHYAKRVVDMGVYNLCNGEIEGFYNGPSRFSPYTPPLWVEPPKIRSIIT